MKAIFVIVLMAGFWGCHSKKNNQDFTKRPESEDGLGSVKDKQNGDDSTSCSLLLQKVNVQENNEIHIVFATDSNALSVGGHLDSVGKSVTCYITMNARQKLKAEVTALNQPANIRFNRILFPDGQSDGPFGKELNYMAAKKGIYKVEIGSNLMAEDSYLGNFIIWLQVK